MGWRACGVAHPPAPLLSTSMAPNLQVALARGCLGEKVNAFEQRVLAKLALHGTYGLLPTPLPGVCLGRGEEAVLDAGSVLGKHPRSGEAKAVHRA